MNDDPELIEMLQGLRKVARGLRWIYVAYVSRTAASIITGVLVSIFRGNPIVVWVILMVFAAVLILGTLMGLVGRAKCRNVPEGSKAHPYIWAAVLLDFVGIGVILAIAVNFNERLCTLIHLFSFISGMVCFMFFLRYTAELIQSRSLAERARLILQHAIWIVASMFVVLIVTVVLTKKAGPAAWGFFVCSFLIAGTLILVLLFQFTNLVRRLSTQIDRVVDAALRRLSIDEHGNPY